MAQDKMTITFENVEIQAFESLNSNLDLKDFNYLVEQAQNKQISEELNEIELGVTLAAREFLIAVQNAQDTIRQAEIIANKLKQIRHIYQNSLPKIRNKTQQWKGSFAENIEFSDQELFSNYNEAKDYMNQLFNSEVIKEVYKKAELFNNKLIQLTQGRELRTIISIIGENGAPQLYEIVDMENFIEERMKFGYSSGKIANLSANFNVGSIQIAEKLKSLKKIDNNKDHSKLNDTIIDILKRYSISGKRRYIMWKLEDGWHKAKVPTQGDFAEAYSYFYFSGKYDFNEDRESNIDTFIMKGVVNVDAISGMYQGDISLSDQVYDYAIKKGNASFLELAQMVKLTEQILLTVKNKGNLKKLINEEYQKEKDKNKDAIRVEISKVGAQSVSKKLKEYLKT